VQRNGHCLSDRTMMVASPCCCVAPSTPLMSGTRKQTRSTCIPRVPREDNLSLEFPIARWGCELSEVRPTWKCDETIGKAGHPHPLSNYRGYQLVRPHRPTRHSDARRGTAAHGKRAERREELQRKPPPTTQSSSEQVNSSVSLSTSIPRLPSFHPSNLIHNSSQVPGALPPPPDAPPDFFPPFPPPI
jgi:hypothetical protein